MASNNAISMDVKAESEGPNGNKSVAKMEQKHSMKKIELLKTVAEKEEQIKEMSKERKKLRDKLNDTVDQQVREMKDKDKEIQDLKTEIRELQKKFEAEKQEVQRLAGKNLKMKILTDRMPSPLKLKKVSRMEHEFLVNKTLRNAKKLSELEKLERKSADIELVIDQIKRETANITELLANRDIPYQPVEQTEDVVSSAEETPGPSRLTAASKK